MLPRLVLMANLLERSPQWQRVLSIRFGNRTDELGFVPVGRHTPVAYVPKSFAVASDGSVWVLDAVKHRLAHFTGDGRFLGEIGGIPFDPHHPSPRDIAMLGETPVLLQTHLVEHWGYVLAPGESGSATSMRVHDARGPLYVSYLIQTVDRSSHAVLGDIEGRAFHVPQLPTRSPQGVADLGLTSGGNVHMLPGVPLGDGGFAAMRFVDSTDVEITFVSASGQSSVLPIRVRLKAGNHTISAVAGGEFQTALRHGVACLIRIAPNSPKDAQRYGGGRWFLELDDDGSPVVWERLPGVSVEDEDVVRHLAVGPDGSVYLMQVNRQGVSIYKR
jgi:hypothetical protein